MRPELADMLTLQGMEEKMQLSVGDWHWPQQWLKQGAFSSIFWLISVKHLHTRIIWSCGCTSPFTKV
jgi:hypothetical protein